VSSLRTSVLILGLAVLGLTQVHAQSRVRGTIESFDGGILSVKGLDIRVTDKTEIVFAQPVALADIKPGDFLGVTSVKHADGKLVAYEIRRFPKPLNPGHRPFDGREDQTMTNATVSATVQSAHGPELTLTYDGGAQKVTVHPEASVSTLVPGHRRQLVPGALVNLTLGEDRVAQRIQVSAPKQ
jgi:hypothetical protein